MLYTRTRFGYAGGSRPGVAPLAPLAPPPPADRIGNATRTRRSGEWGHQRSPVVNITDETRRYDRG